MAWPIIEHNLAIHLEGNGSELQNRVAWNWELSANPDQLSIGGAYLALVQSKPSPPSHTATVAGKAREFTREAVDHASFLGDD